MLSDLKKVTKMVVRCIVLKLKLNWLSYASGVTCQPLGYSKCDKVLSDMDS